MRARHFPVFVLFFVLILCSCGRSAFAGPVKLIAGTSLITDVLQDLCGGNAEILTLVQGSSCPGHEDVKTGDFVFASHADLIVLHAWQERMPQFTTMLKSIERPDLRKVLLTETGSWLVPDNQREASRQAAAALEKAFPEKAGDVRARLAKRPARIDAAEAEAGKKLAPAKGRAVIAAQMQAEFVRWAGFRVLATFGRGEDMSARTLADILQAVKGQKVDGVVDNLQSGAKSGLPLALELGVPHVVLSNFPDSSPDGPDWFSLFSAGVSALAGI